MSLALQNAIDGKLVEPPESWLYKKRWSLPTVLPSEFEHSITGLFGRSKDIAKLERDLRNPRAALIALIARGGVGKTSLLLQVLSDFCLSVEASQYFDGVLWASFKQEKLTSTGIELLSAPQGLAELEVLLCKEASETFGVDLKNFGEMKSSLEEKRMLLCLDNLETLLRDSPQQFNDFYEDLPSKWKVVVTSRIPVDNAKNIPLDVLDKAGSIALARAYFSSRGAVFNDNEQLEKICAGSNYNPLAIRLTIELYLAGADITTAMKGSEQEVLTFSFKNLLEQLSNLQNDLLETVFVLEQPSRSDLCSALDITADQASEAISQLTKMSLIVRQEVESQETYVLGAGIRDLLRSNPRNLQTRSKVVVWLGQSRTNAQEAIRHQSEQNVSPCELSFFPSSAHPSLVALCKQIKAAAKREDRAILVSIEIALRGKLESQPSPLLHRLYAWTALELDDLSTATTHFRHAYALDSSDPAPLFGLALALQTIGNWSELETTTNSLIEQGWGEAERAGKYYANRIWALHLQSLSIQEKLAEVLARTEDWQARMELLPAFAVGRASAFRRQANLYSRQHPVMTPKGFIELGSLLANSCSLMLKVLVREGFFKWYIPELRKIISEIQFHSDHGADFQSFSSPDRQEIQNLLRFSFSNEGMRAGISENGIRVLLGKFERPAQAERQNEKIRIENFLQQGFVIARVKNGARTSAPYFFVQDDRFTDYFVHLDQFEMGNQSRISLVRPHALVALKFDPKDTGNAFRATEAWLIEDPEVGHQS